MNVQMIVIAIVLAACLVFAVLRIRKIFKMKAGDPCYGCALKDACQKHKASTSPASHPHPKRLSEGEAPDKCPQRL